MADEANRENGLEIGRKFGDLETAIERAGKGKTYDSWGEEADETDVQVACRCIHGTCNKGSSECSGGCESGWSGKYCAVPEATGEQMSQMKKPSGTGSGSRPSGGMRHSAGPQIA